METSESAEDPTIHFDIQKLKDRDAKEWKRFITHVEPTARRFLGKMLRYENHEIDNAFQQACLAAYENVIDKYDMANPYPVNWFLAISRFMALNIIARNRKRKKFIILESQLEYSLFDEENAHQIEGTFLLDYMPRTGSDYGTDAKLDGKKIFNEAFKKLTRSKRAMCLRILNSQHSTLDEIGDEANRSRENVRQALTAIINEIEYSRMLMETIPKAKEPDIIPKPEEPLVSPSEGAIKSDILADEYDELISSTFSPEELQRYWRLKKVPLWFAFRIPTHHMAKIVCGDELRALIKNELFVLQPGKVVIRIDDSDFKYLSFNRSALKAV